MKKLLNQIIKFGLVGGLCFVIDYLILIGLVEKFGMPHVLAAGISYSISTVVNYLLSITVVFDAKKNANRVNQFTLFVVLSLIGLGINEIIMWLGTDYVQAWAEARNWGLLVRHAYQLVKIFATGVVMVFNFITRKIFLEDHSRAKKEELAVEADTAAESSAVHAEASEADGAPAETASEDAQ